MKIQITLNIDGSEAYRNFQADDIAEIDWQREVESMAGSILEESNKQ